MLATPVYIEKTAASFERTEEGFRLKEPDYKLLIPNATHRRRMSRMVRMGVATGLQCLGEPAVPADAILTATGLGCLADTEKFMNTILDCDEELLTPTAFIQSTFNTIGAQIALLTGNHGYNNTYVHRAFSLESALIDGALLLQEKDASSVLVGAVDEMTPTLRTILGRFGSRKKPEPGEGAAFFLLAARSSQESLAELRDIELFSGRFTPEEISERMEAFLIRNDAAEAQVVFPDEYKQYCGEYSTAMSFALWNACTGRQEASQVVLLYNSFQDQHSFILIKKV